MNFLFVCYNLISDYSKKKKNQRTESVLGRLPNNDNPPTIIMSELLPVIFSLHFSVCSLNMIIICYFIWSGFDLGLFSLCIKYDQVFFFFFYFFICLDWFQFRSLCLFHQWLPYF